MWLVNFIKSLVRRFRGKKKDKEEKIPRIENFQEPAVLLEAPSREPIDKSRELAVQEHDIIEDILKEAPTVETTTAAEPEKKIIPAEINPPIKIDDMDTEKTTWQDADTKLPPEFDFLRKLVLFRLENYFQTNTRSMKDQLPPLDKWKLPIREFIRKSNFDRPFTEEELILLLIAIAPHVQPDLFDAAVDEHIENDKKHNSADFPRIGGVRGKNCRFFLPTGETVIFLIADDELDKRLKVQQLFGAEHLFWEKKILWLEDMQNGEPAMHGRLIMSPDYVDLLTHGIHKSPQFSISFPAKKIAPSKGIEIKGETGAEKSLVGQTYPPTFKDLVIPGELREQINELINWLQYNDELMGRFKMKGRLRKGYRTLFYGPPGTGKTYTATILGNELKREVYKIDLSMVVSKYIGETEKNLELLFARAEDKEWILFFDEADALFGKRTNVRDAHDKYANQEVSYLLQRIEDYNGLVILATNMKNNIDDAFVRRFNSILKFPFPNAEQRALIWKKAFPADAIFAEKPGSYPEIDRYDAECTPTLVRPQVNVPEEIKKYELTGGSIINVVHYACLKAVERLHPEHDSTKKKRPAFHNGNGFGIDQEEETYPYDPEQKLVIYLTDVQEGIRRELIKEGKPFSL